MLAREFIQDSLYNPHYGYFSTQVEIFDPDKVTGGSEGIDFAGLKNTVAFEEEVTRRYAAEEDNRGEGGSTSASARQVWHTPTELFKVHLPVSRALLSICFESNAISFCFFVSSHGTPGPLPTTSSAHISLRTTKTVRYGSLKSAPATAP